MILYRHLDQSLASSGPLTTLPKPRTVHENPLEPITGLGFREVAEEQHITLFIVTTNRVLMHTGRGNSGSTVVDEVGAGLGCATIDSYAKDIVIARDEAIYICGTDGRGACYAYEGMLTLTLLWYLDLKHTRTKTFHPHASELSDHCLTPVHPVRFLRFCHCP